MRTIGFRAEPQSMQWAVVEGASEMPVLVADDEAQAPAAFDEASSLGWYRSRVLHLLDQYGPSIVALRYAESIGRGANREALRKRCRIEGVLLEASNARALPTVTGALVTISKNLGTKHAKAYLERSELRGLDWSSKPTNRREAILAAVSVLERRQP